MKKLVCLFFITHCALNANPREVCTFISPRSQSVNAARELAGWENQVNIYNDKNSYTSVSLTPEGILSFRPERIVQCFFGDDVIKCERTLHIAGSRVEDRPSMAWLADYFGLPTDYQSRVEFLPRMSAALIDIDCFIGWNKVVPGFYGRVHAPVVYTQWDLNMCETLITTGSNAHDPGYFNPEGIPRIQLVDSFTDFITGTEAPKATNLTYNKLNHAKMRCKGNHTVALSDVQLVLGYNILCNENYHLGFNARCSIPTATRPDGEFLFEPIIGNGHLWELGGGLSTHITLWCDYDTGEKAGIYCDLNVTHLFTTRQCRSFDLKCSPNSRYMLAQKMGTPIADNLNGVVNGARIAPIAQYQKEVTSIANLTTIPVDVSINMQADLAILLAYSKGKNSWTFGYNFWARSCDSIEFCGPTRLELEQWAVKGDSQVFGFEDTGAQTAVALSATQHKATINYGLNFDKKGANTAQLVNEGLSNPNIDNPYAAVSDSDNDTVFVNLVDQPGGSTQINTSIQPILISRTNIDIDSARTRGVSSKMFSSYTRTITGHALRLYIGLGGEIEFGQKGTPCQVATVNQKPCINTAFSYWGVWLKGGISF